jgi:hypothetical protein
VAVVQEAIEELERLTKPADGERTFALLDQHLQAFFTFMRNHPAGVAFMRLEGSANSDLVALSNRYRDRTYNIVIETLRSDPVSDELAAAIRCWVAMNETIVAQLLTRPQLTVEWAARFSAANLDHMLKAALA